MSTTTQYIEATGRRKNATARVRITPAKTKNSFTINDKNIDEYFKTAHLQNTVREALEMLDKTFFSVSVKVLGGGVTAQAEAIRHGISRALVKEDQMRRKELKAAGYLKRDPRTKERKKFGLRSARRAPQWSKR